VVLSYLLMFVSAFLAATFLPFYSEVVLVSYLLEGKSFFWLWAAATLGNTMGAVFTWYLGRYLLHYQDRKWFPFSPGRLGKAQQAFQRYGVWTLLFAWLPVGGDALPFIAGMMRVRLWICFVLTGIGKGGRYAFIIMLSLRTIEQI